MSILNRPSDGLYNVLIAIYKVLAEYGPLSKSDIKSLVVPGDVDDSMVGKTMTRWIQLGFFQEEGSAVSIESMYAPKDGEGLDVAVERLPIDLRSLIFKKENNADFWNSTATTSADFTRGVAWLLAQDVYTFDTTGHDTVQKVEFKQLADANKQILQNNTRWNGLCHWATYLGFAWGGASLVVDPTVALRESLPQVFFGDRTVLASNFLETLAEILPVLDLGSYRQMVESALDPRNWIRPPKLFLSTSLSRALKRLELSGELTLEYRSDVGEAYHLMRQQGAQWGPAFTHIAWNHAEGR